MQEVDVILLGGTNEVSDGTVFLPEEWVRGRADAEGRMGPVEEGTQGPPQGGGHGSGDNHITLGDKQGWFGLLVL